VAKMSVTDEDRNQVATWFEEHMGKNERPR
jgi:hypothetical protein